MEECEAGAKAAGRRNCISMRSVFTPPCVRCSKLVHWIPPLLGEKVKSAKKFFCCCSVCLRVYGVLQHCNRDEKKTLWWQVRIIITNLHCMFPSLFSFRLLLLFLSVSFHHFPPNAILNVLIIFESSYSELTNQHQCLQLRTIIPQFKKLDKSCNVPSILCETQCTVMSGIL